MIMELGWQHDKLMISMVAMTNEYVSVGLNTQEKDENIFASQDPFIYWQLKR